MRYTYVTAREEIRWRTPSTSKITGDLLETIRQYCAGRVAEEDRPEGEATARHAHSRYFASRARQAPPR